MKRIVALVIAAGLTFGATAAQAVDISISGIFDFTAQWANAGMDRHGGIKGYNGSGQNNAFYQRFLTQIDIIASESLSGVLQFEVGDTVWGSSSLNAGESAGGGLGADGVNVKVKNAFLDWIVPQTELHIRMGLQEVFLPGLEDGSQVFADNVAGIVAHLPVNEHLGVTAFWLRPFSDNSSNYDTSGGLLRDRKFNEVDMFGLSLPLTFDGFTVTPWGMYATVGRDFMEGYDDTATSENHIRQMLPRWADPDDITRPSKGQGHAWWLGITGEVTAWDPFRFAWDFNYGRVDMGTARLNGTRFDLERSGWYAALLAEYQFDNVTPGLIFWYGSGDDDNWRNGSEMLPSLHASSTFTSFGQDGAEMNFFGTAFQSGLAGTWGIVARLNDISFIEDLSHTLQVAYYRGTNDKAMAGVMGDPWSAFRNDDGDAYTYMTDKDSAWEINFNSYYDIYKNLTVGLELGYICLDLSESAWGKDVVDRREYAWKAGLGLRYTF